MISHDVSDGKFISSVFLINSWIIETTFSFIFGRRNGEKEKEVEKWAKELNVVLKAWSEVYETFRDLGD